MSKITEMMIRKESLKYRDVREYEVKFCENNQKESCQNTCCFGIISYFCVVKR